MAADTIVTAVTTVIIICLLVIFMDYAVPLFMKLDFNRTCNTYATIVASEGALTSDQVVAFKQSLAERGFEDIAIDIDNTSGMKFGEPIHFYVATAIKSHKRTSMLNREEYKIPCIFDTKLYYRKYIH